MIDIAIIGGGPAALGAALYAARSGKSVTVFEQKFIGGQAAATYEVDNYLGFSGSPSGSELTGAMYDHVAQFNVQFIYSAVKEILLQDDIKKIVTSKKEFDAKAVILAMGASPSRLNIPGETEFSGKGISYCATCDGMFFKDKTVCVAGGGNTAVEDAIYLSPIARKVYIIHRRDEFRASPLLVEKLKTKENVEFILNSTVTSASGGDFLEHISVQDKNGAVKTISASALFVAVGVTPCTDLLGGQLNCDENGFIITDENMSTDIPGVFAAGDIRKKTLRQIITAVSDGAIAGEEAAKYINSI